MTTMITEVYEALREAGVSEEKSKAAAEAIEIARNGGRLERIEGRLTHVEERLTRLEEQIADVKADVRLMKWMLGFNLAISMAVLFKLLV